MKLSHVYVLMILVTLYIIMMIYVFQYHVFERKTDGRSKVPHNLIILVSQPRSGSTYISNLLSKPFDSLYFYEPLYQLDKHFRIDINFANKTSRKMYDEFAESSLRNLFKCNFNQKEELKRLTKSPFKDLSVFSGCDKRSAESIKPRSKQNNIDNCMPFVDPHNLQKDCRKNGLMVKLLEMRIPKQSIFNLNNLIKNSVDFKVIYLIRDPRASFWSLLQTKWVADSIESAIFKSYIRNRCKEMEENIKASKTNNHVIITRYEDIIAQPRKTLSALKELLDTEKLNEIFRKMESNNCYVPAFADLNINRYEELKHAVEQDKIKNNGDFFDTYEEDITRQQETLKEHQRKNYLCSSINKWRYQATMRHVNVIERSCVSVMKTMRYEMVNGDWEKLKNFKHSLVK